MKVKKNNLFIGQSGTMYFVLFGEVGSSAMLLSTESNEIVLCAVLEERSWHHGEYFMNFEDAYKVWKEKYNG